MFWWILSVGSASFPLPPSLQDFLFTSKPSFAGQTKLHYTFSAFQELLTFPFLSTFKSLNSGVYIFWIRGQAYFYPWTPRTAHIDKQAPSTFRRRRPGWPVDHPQTTWSFSARADHRLGQAARLEGRKYDRQVHCDVLFLFILWADINQQSHFRNQSVTKSKPTRKQPKVLDIPSEMEKKWMPCNKILVAILLLYVTKVTDCCH